MPHTASTGKPPDTGLGCLVIIARFLGVAADERQLRHRFAHTEEPVDANTLIRAARHVGLKARPVIREWQALSKTPLPALAQHQDGHWLVIAKADSERVLIQDPLEGRPLTLPRELFESSWNGAMILLTRRAPLLDENIRFGFRWFIPALRLG